MSLQELTDGMRDRVGEDCGLGAVVKWDFGDDEFLMLDATQVPNVVTNDDGEADCTLKIALDDFLSMIQGELDGTTAFMTGKLKIEGDMGIAMKLQGVLSGG
ncbi:MAG: SCP2 sterol-binding domain-containing protein [Rhodospirillaceae bacterium]|jgi:putative sterol carrier protein|nr:SCP2 sterol-binding domain-containing protein [Rhodospirillaceae bacterium]MBT4046587.1 SCP2 sterol-binding domain-containing protein [Rhodospirillaceae bacterium]MBT4690851.1 SCP2 sterol-binding domain-containing protein [Rhodospirillaceae bacterium]MBT5081568.1 SCP2 sterol-binding domain-containing protein [Rhodospirillaceae bacterium]MBT5527010.1 SCP2 sterol-binding domain-containing protein [Rhodospirillaceae bacterium]